MALEFEEPAGDGASGDTLGVEMALARAAGGAGRDPIADALLQKQTEKLCHELHHLKLRTVSEWVSLVLKGLGALLALGAVIALAVFVFQAMTSRAQLVEPFHVPPDMAEKGVDGSVLAGQVLDKLNAMYAATQKETQNTGYSAEQATETKLEIPETGVSLGELQRLLQAWLGHDVRISGSLVRQGDQKEGSQVVLTARTGSSAKSFAGPEADLDKLTTQAAESIYAATQPLPFVDYLRTNRRYDEAEVLLKRLTSVGSPSDRAWAYSELGEVLMRHEHDYAGAQHAMDEAVSLNPELWVVWDNLANLHNFFVSDEEQALAYRRKAVAAHDFGGADANSSQHFHLDDQIYIDEQVGDFSHAMAIASAEVSTQREPALAYQSAYLTAYEAAYLYDVAASQLWTRRALDRVPAMEVTDGPGGGPQLVSYRLAYWRAAAIADWAMAAGQIGMANTVATGSSDYWHALEAIARVGNGQLAQAQALLAPLPAHCLYCNVARALLAEAGHDRRRADAIFAGMARDYPSIVRGQDWWGRVKLARGDYDGAIAVFVRLNKIGPHFAHALEGWGEALQRKGDIAGAAEKFAEAAKYAPHWGHLRLFWGAALKMMGRRDEAAAQFAAARGLALSAQDRALLAAQP